MSFVRIVDFETSGTAPPDGEVCEVGVCDVDTRDGSIAAPESWLCGVRVMPPEVRAVHHIALAECAGQAPFESARMLPPHVVAVAAHNAAFEAQFFTTSLPLICTYKAALRVWPNAPTHSNGGLRYWLEDQGLIKPVHALTMPAHRAGPDAYVTAHIFQALRDAGATAGQLIAWTKLPALLPTCPIGKFRGMPWADVEAGFLGWMLRQPDMDEELKWNARQEIARRDEAGNV